MSRPGLVDATIAALTDRAPDDRVALAELHRAAAVDALYADYLTFVETRGTTGPLDRDVWLAILRGDTAAAIRLLEEPRP